MKMIPIVSGTAPMACDEQDYLMLSRYHWRALTNAHHQYAKTQIRGHTILAHRLILGLEKGDQRVADHINGNGLDNRRCNLRIVTRKENRWNLRKTNSLSGAIFKPQLAIVGTFINTPVKNRKNSLSSVINVAPKMAPGILPMPPIMTIAIYSTESPRLKGSVVMLTM